MEFDDSFAWLITWTTYGSWLPGDARGHVSPVLLADGRFQARTNTPGIEWAKGDERTRKRARELQRFPSVRLGCDEALLTAESIVEAARTRNWSVLRGAVMATHVHVVLQDGGADKSAISRVLKGVSQARLNERFGKNPRWWTHGGSDRGLRGAQAVAAGVEYVKNQDYILAEIIDNESRRFQQEDGVNRSGIE